MKVSFIGKYVLVEFDCYFNTSLSSRCSYKGAFHGDDRDGNFVLFKEVSIKCDVCVCLYLLLVLIVELFSAIYPR